MRKILLFIALAELVAVSVFADSRVALVPKPLSLVEKVGTFRVPLNANMTCSPELKAVALLFAQESGIKLNFTKSAPQDAFTFRLVDKKTVPDSTGYRIQVTPTKVAILASSRSGALLGMHSLLQLLLIQSDKNTLPCLEIYDKPRYAYRGVHLDVSRNFFSVDYIKRFIRLMALYKLNTFHWHLTDGAGWRLEIKKYPRLTSVAAWRTHSTWKAWWEGGRKYSEEGRSSAHGGYYTQQEARDVVEFAAQRGITVIPEIEMPGHSEEVLAAYPHLSCTGIPYSSSEFCIGNDSTFIFLENVLTEVMAIFPSKYIHIGGDEANKEHWKKCPKCQQRIKENGLKDELELQSYCIRRMEKFLSSHGRRLLGWDEILEGGLAPGATVMSWRGEQGGITAAQQGHDVIMTPGAYCYFDSYQADPETQPLAIGGYLPLEKVYSYQPTPASLLPEQQKHVLGAQANLWTEYIPTFEHLEYMAFPRLIALSEVVWTEPSLKNWTDFKERMQAQYVLLQRKNVTYCRPSYHLEIQPEFNYRQHFAEVNINSELLKPEIRYTMDGTTPTLLSPRYEKPFRVSEVAKVHAAVFEDGEMRGRPSMLQIDFHKAIGKTVIYNHPYCPRYAAQKESTLVNGYRGTLTYSDGQWQGFETVDMDVTVDMGEALELSSLSVGFMQQIGPGVYMPDSVVVSLSNDGVNFHEVQNIINDVPSTRSELTFKDFKCSLKNEKARYIRVLAKNGKHGFLFADEIVIY